MTGGSKPLSRQIERCNSGKKLHHVVSMKRSLFILSILVLQSGFSLIGQDNWNQFRGPTGRGHVEAGDVPVKWDEKSVAWSVDLPGVGQSSPVNWGNRVFLTSAEEGGKLRHVICIDLETGETLWQRTMDCENPEQAHKMNTQATPSCATDGERVFAFFGPAGLHCFDLDGNPQWSQQLGDFPGVWGIAASPVLFEDTVIQNCDCSGPSRLVAFDRKTGDIRWETERVEKPRGGWSTPIIIDTGERKELVLNGEYGVRGYNPSTGEELWFCKGFNGRGAPVPDFANGALFVVNGKPGDLYSVRPGGSGDVTETHMRWHQGRKAGRDLPSPAVVGNVMTVVDMAGIGAGFDTGTGEVLWNDRLGIRGEFAASPLVANGLVYFTNVYGGETVVIKPGPEKEIVSVNPIGAAPDEIFRATIAPVDGKLLIRSHSRLYLLGGL